jgi:hypothetical protein
MAGGGTSTLLLHRRIISLALCSSASQLSLRSTLLHELCVSAREQG